MPPKSQPTNGVNSGRKSVSSTPKSKSENRGRPKGSGKKEKVTEEASKKKVSYLCSGASWLDKLNSFVQVLVS